MPRGGWTGGRRASDLTIEEIRHTYLDPDVSMKEACKTLQCSPKILIAAMRMHGLTAKPKTRKIGFGRKLEHKQLADHVWLVEQIEKRSFPSIARELGMSGASVRSYAIRHGLYQRYATDHEGKRVGASKADRQDVKYSKITAEDIQRVYWDTDANIHKAARDLGCSYPTLIRAMEALGIPPKSHGRSTRRWTENSKDFPELDDPSWLKEHIQQQTKKSIAIQLGTTVWNVDFHIKKHGLTSWELPYVPVPHIEQLPRRKRGEYIEVFLPSHPYASNSGYIFEHRVILENHLGRYLGPNEVGHHKHEPKDDNRPSNLEVLTRQEHARLHFQQRADAMKERDALRAEIEALKAAQQRTQRKVDRLIVDNQLHMFDEPEESV